MREPESGLTLEVLQSTIQFVYQVGSPVQAQHAFQFGGGDLVIFQVLAIYDACHFHE